MFKKKIDKIKAIAHSLGYKQEAMGRLFGFKGKNVNVSYGNLVRGQSAPSTDSLLTFLSNLSDLNKNWFFDDEGEMWKSENKESGDLAAYRKVISDTLQANQALEAELEAIKEELKAMERLLET